MGIFVFKKIWGGNSLKSILLALLLGVVGLLNAQDFTVGDLNYSVNSDGVSVKVTGHVDGTAATGTLTIPASVTYSGNDYAVTKIEDNAFSECTGITSFTIPNSVNVIGGHAFYGTGWWNSQPDGVVYKDNCCLGYKGDEPTGPLEISAGTRLIADGAFNSCSGLTSLTLPNSLKAIGYSFYKCTGITSFTIPNSVNNIRGGAFYETGWWNNQPNGVVYKDHCCLGYKGSEPTGALQIADGTRLIGGGAFFECYGLTSVMLPNSLGNICISAFAHCTGLASIESQASTPPVLDEYAFYNVTHSIPVTVPHGTLAAYQSAQGWSDFTNWVEAPPTAIAITEIEVEGFTAPEWGEHPDFEVEVPSDAHYYLDEEITVEWLYYDGHSTYNMSESDIFDHEDYEYAMSVVIFADDYYEFAEDVVVFFNEDASVLNSEFSENMGWAYNAWTIWFSVTAPVPSNTIDEIHVNGFTAPVFGAHPDFSLTVPNNAHYAVDEVVWYYNNNEMSPSAAFNDAGGTYYMLVYFVPESGYAFDPNATVLFNGDASINDAYYNAILSDGTFAAYTIDYQVTGITPSTYTVTATANPSVGGTVTGGGTYNSGTTCTLTATANGGYQFLNWTKNGAEVSTNATYSFTVTESAQYVANFIQSSTQTYMLTVSCDPSMGAVTGNGTYAAGTQVTVEAIAYKGYAFDSWNDGVTANPRTVTLTGNMTLVAFFKGTGVNENGLTALSVYPNPAKDVLRIEGLESNATVEIYNSLGMMVKTASASADEEINISDLPQGIYMLRCGKQTVRFVKTM